MDINKRLEKLERASHLDSEFCDCSREVVTRVIYPDLDRTEEEYQESIADAEKPENCNQCGKVIEKRLIIVETRGGNDARVTENA